MYKKYEVSPKILDAESRLREAESELENAKNEAEEAQKNVWRREEEVSKIEAEIRGKKEAVMPYEDFVNDLTRLTDELTRKWNSELKDKPVFLIRGKEKEGCPRANRYHCYPAFAGSGTEVATYREVWKWSWRNNTSFLNEEDPNYSLFKKTLEEHNVIINTKALVSTVGYEICLNRIIALVYVFFYRDSGDFGEALTKTKELVEKQSLKVMDEKELGRLEDKIICLLYEKYFEHT